ncbi:steroid dehydrogenase [Cavenderia fasciculata]|uniref:Steroid dehydrogenase n=1 Tax=Cavenderia fasciculata TaxID=261658 RepID=F4QEF2_CACFS|nr:steroid dehydrogenase [Cavenderia fasciculata]EGG13265.1 steroid dehydrogenase [Cavenderia fasciculata]|eukprot:XP_004349964.1 steroid dehydrogenase [Cavenderia fasciculata]
MISIIDIGTLIGLAFIAVHLYKFLNFVYASTIRPSTNLKKYGDWAVVTGATDGIGKAYAYEFAKRGMNIVLISRSQDKLNDEAQKIQSKYPKIQTKTVAFDFNTSDDSKYESLYKQHLSQVDIGVLVNNVGISYDHPMYLEELSVDRINALVNMNVKSMIALTRLVVPSMITKKRGAIINLSSISGMSPIPFLSVYSGTKAFVHRFSNSLSVELADKGIFVQCVAPGIVVSNMSKVRKPSLFVPLPEAYARSAISTIGYERTTSGYWAHKIQTYLITSLPSIVSDKVMYDMHASQRKRALSKKKSQ